MLNFLKKLVREEEGQDFVEYALLLAGVSLTLLTALETLSGGISGLYGRVVDALAA